MRSLTILLCLFTTPALAAPIVQVLELSRSTEIFVDSRTDGLLSIGTVNLTGTATGITDFDNRNFKLEWVDRSTFDGFEVVTGTRSEDLLINVNPDPFGVPILEEQTVTVETLWSVVGLPANAFRDTSFDLDSTIVTGQGVPFFPGNAVIGLQWINFNAFAEIERIQGSDEILRVLQGHQEAWPGIRAQIAVSIECDFSPVGCLMTPELDDPQAFRSGIGVPQLYEVPEPAPILVLASLIVFYAVYRMPRIDHL